MSFPWIPMLLCVLVADVNFWYYASTGENHADYAGIALFLGLAAFFFRRAVVRQSAAQSIPAFGSLAAAGLMAAREAGAFDRGYILPYAVVLLFLAFGGAVAGARRFRPASDRG